MVYKYNLKTKLIKFRKHLLWTGFKADFYFCIVEHNFKLSISKKEMYINISMNWVIMTTSPFFMKYRNKKKQINSIYMYCCNSP